MADDLPIRRLLAGKPGPAKPWSTILVLAALSALTYASPALSRLRPASPAAARAAWRSFLGLAPAVRIVEWTGNGLPPQLRAAVEVALPDLGLVHARVSEVGLALAASQWSAHPNGSVALLPRTSAHVRANLPGREIEDPAGLAMAPFYAALADTRAGRPGAVTRVLHFGDSPVTGDLISSGARARLQTRYGDAGHGFIFVGRPWEWYNHLGVELSSSGWRMLSPLFSAGNDGAYGLGGVCFVGGSPAAGCRVGTVAKGLGTAVSRFDVHFQARPGGGTLLASVDGEPDRELPTAAGERAVTVVPIHVPDGPHTLTLRPKGDGEVVLFGVALERDGPGVVYSSLGTNGGTIHFLTLLDERCWGDELRAAAPHLVVLNYGTNESGYGYFSFDAYAAEIREVVRRVRAAVPSAAILLMAPMDRGTFDETGEIVTMATIPRIVATQRAVAAATGCAYFDTFRAMGGEGTMGRWYLGNTRLVTGDLTHPTGVGADLVAGLLVDALEAGFAAYAAEPGAGASAQAPDGGEPCPEPPPDAAPAPPSPEAVPSPTPAAPPPPS